MCTCTHFNGLMKKHAIGLARHKCFAIFMVVFPLAAALIYDFMYRRIDPSLDIIREYGLEEEEQDHYDSAFFSKTDYKADPYEFTPDENVNPS